MEPRLRVGCRLVTERLEVLGLIWMGIGRAHV